MIKPTSLSIVMLLCHSFVSEGEETYLLGSVETQEWQPPVSKAKALPNRLVKKTLEVEQGGRNVCIEECEAPVEQEKVKVEKIETITPQTFDPSLLNEDYIAPKLLFISATVYKEGEKEFSHIRLQCESQKVEAWSSMNFMEMAGMNQYMARGIKYYTHVGHGMEHTKTASEAGCPVRRDKLNQEKAKFIVVGDTSKNPEALEAMKGLHAIYNKESEALKAAYKVRLVNQEKAFKWHAENPPQPKDITVRFWKREIQKEEK